MQLIEIDPQKGKDFQRFHGVARYIYQNDPLWIAPLEGDIEKIFSYKNHAFTTGKCRLWVLRNGTRDVGRIAAFVDEERNAQQNLRTGGIGLFECINDRTAAFTLFRVAEDYLRTQNVEAMDGPINFGERDKFWGLLTHGWYPPIYQETYNPAYYQAWFEEWGFISNEQCLTMHGRIADFPVDRLDKLAARVRERYGLYCRQITRGNLREGADWFAAAYNGAFQNFSYFKPLTGEQIWLNFKQMKPILDRHLTCVAFDGDQPVGFCGLIPDLNEFFRGMRGKVTWYKLPTLLYRLQRQKRRSVKGIAFGIHVDYQRKGVFPLMVDYMYQSGNQHNVNTYDFVDMATIRGHNDLMVETCRTMNVDVHRVHIAYRKPLVADLVWQPFKHIDVSAVDLGAPPPAACYPVE